MISGLPACPIMSPVNFSFGQCRRAGSSWWALGLPVWLLRAPSGDSEHWQNLVLDFVDIS